jgi:signal transduction histidine kinase
MLERLKTIGDFDQQLVDRVLLLVACAVAINALAAAVDWFSVVDRRPLLFSSYAVVIVAGLGLLAWMHRVPTRRTATVAAIAGIWMFCLEAALAGTIAGGYAATTLFCMGLLWVTAAMLPWGLREQTATCAAAAVSMVVTFLAHRDGVVPGILPRDLITVAVGASFSLIVAWILAGERRTTHQRLRRAEDEVREFGATLERRIAERTHALETANLEMQTFCHSVSHDLRGPLRAIGGFAELVLNESPETLDEQATDHIRRVHAAALRMDCIIDDLLRVARIAQRELSDADVDLSAIAEDVVAELRRREPERGARIAVHLDRGLRVRGDRKLLVIVLEHLLGNAWKFVDAKVDARVEFEEIDVDGKPTYVVRDNGVGFDMRFAGKLFAPFEKLHDGKDYDGTGIGLAIVERIVRRHGGTIWADSEPGRGTAMYLRLPGMRRDGGTRATVIEGRFASGVRHAG